jgi:hypothetical protein
MENSAFTYVTSPLEMAESMAFHLDCLGMICWFEWGKIVNLPGKSVVRVEAQEDWLSAIRRACDEWPSLSVGGPDGLCAELTEQPGRRLVHLVNYRADAPAADVKVCLRLPAERHPRSVVLASPEHASDRSLPFEEHPGEVAFGVPRVNVYEIAIVSYQP